MYFTKNFVMSAWSLKLTRFWGATSIDAGHATARQTPAFAVGSWLNLQSAPALQVPATWNLQRICEVSRATGLWDLEAGLLLPLPFPLPFAVLGSFTWG